MNVTIQGMGAAVPTQEQAKTDTSTLTDFIPPRKLRRIDHFTRMSLLAAYRALHDANSLETLPARLGIVLSTGYGPSQTTFDFLDSIIEDGAPLASPLAFSHSVHNIPAGVLSIQLGSACPQTTLCQLRQPVSAGLRTAALWLADGTADAVLFGAVDETTPLLEANYNQLFPDQMLSPQEGATFFLLNTSETGIAQLELTASIASQDSATTPKAMPTQAACDIMAAVGSVQDTASQTTCQEGANTFTVRGMKHG